MQPRSLAAPASALAPAMSLQRPISQLSQKRRRHSRVSPLAPVMLCLIAACPATISSSTTSTSIITTISTSISPRSGPSPSTGPPTSSAAPTPTTSTSSSASSHSGEATASLPVLQSPPVSLTCDQETLVSSTFRPGPQQYLVVGRVMEQLSKARRHLAELGALAQHANRTLVLPHGGASRLGPASDFHLPLCAYFDVGGLPPALRWVSEEFFYQEVVPELEGGHGGLGFCAVLLMIRPKRRCDFKDAMMRIGGSMDSSAPTPWANTTLTRRLLEAPDGPGPGPEASTPGGVPVVCLTECPVRPRKERSADELLARYAPLRTAPVVLAVRGTPYPCVPKEFWNQNVEGVLGAIQYAPQLERAAGWIQECLGGAPLVAIQWRTEKAVERRTPRWRMMRCACGALDRARRIQRRLSRKHERPARAFLATDIDANRSALSSSMSGGGPHFEAAWTAAQAIRHGLETFEISDYIPEVHSADLGIRAILEKIICIRADTLLTPPADCRGKGSGNGRFGSSFLEEICVEREKQGRRPCQAWSK